VGSPEDARLLGEGSRRVQVLRLAEGVARRVPDRVVHEEPLEIRLGAAPVAVVMRTPGQDLELVTGFLVTEGVVERAEQIHSVRHCSQATEPAAEDNVVRVTLAADVPVDVERLRRNLFASSSCGICGKASLDRVLATAAPLEEDPARFSAARLLSLPEQMRASQRVFEQTGGLHAAGLFDPGGRLQVVREDVGRHNAVDKVIGWAARAGRLPLRGHALLVSGRVSFEVVQKALAARIPLVAAVSAPSSLAVSLAEASGMALVGFLRAPCLNVYAGSRRIALD